MIRKSKEECRTKLNKILDSFIAPSLFAYERERSGEKEKE